MDWGDLFAASAGEGSRRMRWIAAIIIGLLGAAIGAFWGAEFGETDLAPYSHGFIGAIVGGGLGALFAFAVFVLLAIVLVVAVIVGWQVMTGAT